MGYSSRGTVRTSVSSRRRHRRRLVSAVGFAVAALGIGWSPSVFALDGTWTLNNTGPWGTSGNWSGGTIADGATFTANFSTLNITAATRTVNLDTSRIIGTILIGDSNTTDRRSYAIAPVAAETLTFDNGGSAAVLTQIANSNGDTISAPVILNSALNVTNASTMTLTLSTGGISAGTLGTKTISILGTATGTVAFSGAITPGAGDVAITKGNANNTLTLSGTNTFTGGVTLNAGTLNLTNTTALGGAAGTLTINGGTLTGSVTIANANPKAWNGNFTYGGASNLNLGAGAVTMNDNRQVTVAGSGTFTAQNVGESGGARSLTTVNSGNVITGIIALDGTNTYTGGTFVNGGVFRFANGAAIPATGAITVQSGGALSISGAHNTIAGWLGNPALSTASTGAISFAGAGPHADPYTPGAFATLSLGANVGVTATYTGTYTPPSTAYFAGGGGGTIIFSNSPAFTGVGRTLTVGNGGGGTVVLSGSNDYSGATTVVAGATLQLNDGGSIESTSGVANAGTLVFNRSDTSTFTPAVSGAGALTKTGTGTVTLASAQSYTGATSVNQGTLSSSVNQNLSGALQYGNANNVTTNGTFSLTTTDAAFGSMLVQTNSTNANTLNIAAGQTLTINGNVTIGTSVGASTTTSLTGTGGGAIVVNNTGASGVFVLGGTTGAASQGNRAIANLAGLSSLTVSLNTTSGVFRVNPTNGSNVDGKFSTLTLPSTGVGNTTITASQLIVGDSQQNNASAGQINSILLGTGLNDIRVGTVNIGTGGRDAGSVTFNTSNGDVRIRNATNDGPAAFNMGTGAANTGVAASNTFDVLGHDADLLLGAVNIGTQPRSANLTNLFAFDTGTLSMTSLTMSTKGTGGSTTNGGTRITTSTMELAGGTVTITNGVLALGAVSSASGNNAAGNFDARGIINISGDADVTIGNTGGTSITMAGVTLVAGQTASGTVNITGGTTSLSGDIVKTGAFAGSTATATVTLDGGTLDMNGQNIGGTVAIDNLNFRSGTLDSVGQINNGATGLTKTAGVVVPANNTLTLIGANAYTGPTTVSEGTLLVNGVLSSTSAVAVNGASTLGGTGTIRPTGATAGNNVALASTAFLAPGASIGTLTIDSSGTSATSALDLSSGAVLQYELGAGLTSDQVAITNAAAGDVLFGNNVINFTDLTAGALTNGAYTLFSANVAGAYSGLTTDGGNNITAGLTIGSGLGAYPGSTLQVAGNNIVLNVVPEPGTAGLLAVAAAGLLARRRRS